MRKLDCSVQRTTVFSHRQPLPSEYHLSLGLGSGILLKEAGNIWWNKKDVCLPSQIMLFILLKSMLPVRSRRHFLWANTQADLQPDTCVVSGIVHAVATVMKHWDEEGWLLFINAYPTWPDLLSRSYQTAPVSSSARIATVTDPMTLRLHTLSQS